MRTIFKTMFIFLVGMFSIASMAGTPVAALVPIDHIYVPKGFDSNDNTEIIVEGYLPNLCHRSPTTSVKKVDGKIFVDVKALKYDSSNPFCPEVLVPFIESVNLGLMDKGFYDIIVNGSSIFRKESKIFIAESSSNAIDNHIYANVDYVEKDEDSRTIKLVGYTPSDCLVLDKIETVTNDKDTMAVLPMLKQVSDFCPMKMTPFKYEMEVPKKLKREKILLHVRAMDGKSVNTLFNNEIDNTESGN
jgi:hypothetical protein